MSGAYICPAWGYDLRPVACKHRALDWLRSNRARRHLCDGPACPHYRAEWEAKVATEILDRPKCGCGEPLPPARKLCDDCTAYERQRQARRRAARLKALKAAGPAFEGLFKEVEMGKEEMPVAHKYGSRPLPEGATVTKKGRVFVGTSEKVPCPKCPAGWMCKYGRACQPCTPPRTAEEMARMRQAKAAKPTAAPKINAACKKTIQAAAETIAQKAAEGGTTTAEWTPASAIQESLTPPQPAIARIRASKILVVDGMNPVKEAIWDECEALAEMLMAKNAAYGNSALDPVRVFSKASAEEQIRVRLDDKLSRLMRGDDAGEDVELDLMGYLVLLRVQRRLAKGEAA